MTLPATAVTGVAMGPSGSIHLGMHTLVWIGPHIYHFLEWGKAHMKTALIILRNLIMARSTCLRSVRIRRIFDHTLMGCFPIWIIGIAAMAFVTAKFTMVFILGYCAINPQLFVRSQRLHVSASPLPFGLSGASWFVLVSLCDLPCDLYQLTGIRMTGETIVLTVSRTGLLATIKQD